MARIFISYSRDDGLEIARELANRLRAAEHDVFLDMQSIRAGSRWHAELDRRIKWSDLIVVLVTEGSNNSDYVYREVIEADKRGKIIVPVRIDDTPLPVHLRGTWQAVMLEDDDLDGVLLELERTIRQLSKPKLFSRGCIFSMIGIVIAVALIAAFLVLPSLNEDDDETPTSEPESVAQLTEEAIPPTATDTPQSTETAISSETPVPTNTVTETPPPTETPIPTDTSVPTDTPVFFPAGSRNKDWKRVIKNFDGVQMVQVPAGCFMMGSSNGEDNERPVHEVCFEEPFWIDRFEVTNAQYGASGYFSGDSNPRESITWSEANFFCDSRDARLPTEAEWEYAARGPGAWIYPWGNEFVSDNLTYGVNSNGQTASVGTRPKGASWVGALDMSGNVWEWVADWYGPYESGTKTNPTGPDSGEYRIIRGSAWPNVGTILRASTRSRRLPGSANTYTGFRCARDN